MKTYLGVKTIEAEPMNLGEYNTHRGWKIPEGENPDSEGYLVRYPDGYISWSPKEQFEEAYLLAAANTDGVSISEEMVESFISEKQVTTLGDKTTMVRVETVTGFVIYKTSSCVDPKNYDEKIGADICMEKIKGELWHCLGFVLQWGKDGLKN